ncbi:MAG: hypothetical protein KDJ73_06535 [Notoacmeibacter sp.]|nr:hypothetical protein [Notoacmeibacter sp.]MCC0031563.1 hypothetical protein [Brucellaceae bacterium]
MEQGVFQWKVGTQIANSARLAEWPFSSAAKNVTKTTVFDNIATKPFSNNALAARRGPREYTFMAGSEFHLAEYAALRDEILDKSRFIDQSWRLMIVAVAGILAWVLTTGQNADTIVRIAASWLPAAMSLFFHWHRNENIVAIRRLALYVRALEERFADDGLGWERRRSEDDLANQPSTYRSTTMLMKVTVVFSVLFAALETVRAISPDLLPF